MDKRKIVGEIDGDGVGLVGVVSVRRIVGWMGMGYGEDK